MAPSNSIGDTHRKGEVSDTMAARFCEGSLVKLVHRLKAGILEQSWCFAGRARSGYGKWALEGM